MSASRRLREFLDSRKVKYVVISHSQAFTAQEIAASMHIPGREMAKAVVIRTPRGLALAVLRAMDKVDLNLIRGFMGSGARLADELEFAHAFPDCEVGAMPPFGNLYDIPTYVDEALTRDKEIVFNAGTHSDAIRMMYADYVAAVRPAVMHISHEYAGSIP